MNDPQHRAVSAIVNGLRASPLLLALVVLVLIGTGFNYWLVHNLVRSSNERVQYLIEQLIACQNQNRNRTSMATNISLTTFENCAVIYFDNGATNVINPHTEYFLQLADMGFCTISEAKDPDAAEHPPQAFVDAMVAFWTALAEEIREDTGPVATPV